MNDKKFSVLAAIALTACMILGLSGWTVESARAVDLDQECSLTVSPGEAEDLQNADVVLDLYQVARAVPVSGYDTYSLRGGGSLRGSGRCTGRSAEPDE